jgi:bacteriocin-like protein
MRITRKGQHRPTSNKEATMKLIGELKEKVEKAETAEAKKELIEEAGMELDDEELEQVSGGLGNLKNPIVYIGKAL